MFGKLAPFDALVNVAVDAGLSGARRTVAVAGRFPDDEPDNYLLDDCNAAADLQRPSRPVSERRPNDIAYGHG